MTAPAPTAEDLFDRPKTLLQLTMKNGELLTYIVLDYVVTGKFLTIALHPDDGGFELEGSSLEFGQSTLGHNLDTIATFVAVQVISEDDE